MPSAVATAMLVSGLDGPWLFVGFPPAKATARRKALDDLQSLPCALVFYEAPHRIEECVADLLACLGGERSLLIARELTKRFEQIHQCTLADAPAPAPPDASRVSPPRAWARRHPHAWQDGT